MIKKVFITGINGFIGRSLEARLNSRGISTGGVDLADDPARHVVAGDVSEPGIWQEALAAYDVVIHTAALVSYAMTLDDAWRVNVVGTKNVVDAVRDSRAGGKGVKRLVHFSSVVVLPAYGNLGELDETTPVRADGRPYIDTKIAAENLVLQAYAAKQIDCTIVRPGDVYGPGSRPWVILPVEAIKSGMFLLPSSGKGMFTPVFIDNLLDGVELVLEGEQSSGQVFIFTDGKDTTCKDFFSYYFRMLDKKRGPIVLPTIPALAVAGANDRALRLFGKRTESNPDSVKYFTRTSGYSIAKAQKVLGYSPAVTLPEGMKRTEAWLRESGYLS